MTAHRWSRLLYRLALRAYPREFRERFRADLESDFLQLIASRGLAHAWRRAVADLFHAVPLTTTDALAERARRARVGGPISPAGESPMRSVLFDLRHAVRALLKAPAFTALTIATLAMGIGANSAIFGLVNAVLLRPLGYQAPERLMLIYEVIPESGVPRFDMSPPDYLDLVQYQRSFDAIGAYRTRLAELSSAGDPEQVPLADVSASVLPILGVSASRGRVFLPDEDQRDTFVAVISDGLWRRKFAGREIIGERLMLDRKPYTIVGVMPASFQFPKRGATTNSEPADVWVPLAFNPFERRARGMFYNHTVIGRLRNGVTPEQAASDTAALATRIRDNYPAALRSAPLSLQLGTISLTDEISGRVRQPLLVLLGAVGLVLLIACANVANLILSRSVTRQREIGVRAALGAGRLRLFQMLLIEGLVLAACGGTLGMALGHWAVRKTPAVIATSLPGVSDVSVDARVLAFTLALSLGSAAAFGLVPLAAGMRRDLHDLLREGTGRSTGGRRQRRVQATLVVTSVALAFVLLVSAALLMRSFTNLIAIDSGVGAKNVLSMQVRLPYAAYNDAGRIRAAYRALAERLRALPGVRAASVSSDLPLEEDGERRVFTPDRSAIPGVPPSVAVTWVHGDFFAAFGVPLIKGRSFSGDEQRENRHVAIVSKRLADTYWPGETPIGQRIKWGLPASAAPWQTVIGVAGDVVDGPPGSDPVNHIYVPYTDVADAELAAPAEGLLRRLILAIRSEQDAGSLTAGARGVVAEIDPALAVARVQTLAQINSDRSAPQRFSAVVLTAFAIGALLLAAIGLYGVLAFTVSQRRRELGVRMALGAPRREIFRLVVGEGMAFVLVGLAIGGAAAAGATRLLRTLLFETNTYDPLTFAVVPLVLAAAALAACYAPARRAARVDPIITLRAE